VRNVFRGLCHCAKFGCKRYGNFDNMQVLIFYKLGLKISNDAPKWEFWRIRPQNGSSMNAAPKRAKRRSDGQNRSSLYRCGLDGPIQKTCDESHITKTTHVVAAPRGFACDTVNYLYSTFYRNPVMRSEPNGSIFAHFHYFKHLGLKA